MFEQTKKMIEIINKPRNILKGEHSQLEWECAVLKDISFLDDIPEEYKTIELYKKIFNKLEDKSDIKKYITQDFFNNGMNKDFLKKIIKYNFEKYSFFKLNEIGFDIFDNSLIKEIIKEHPDELSYINTKCFIEEPEDFLIYHLNEIFNNNKESKNFDNKRSFRNKYEKIIKFALEKFLINFKDIKNKKIYFELLIKNIQIFLDGKGFLIDYFYWSSSVVLRNIKNDEMLKFFNEYAIKNISLLKITSAFFSQREFLLLINEINLKNLSQEEKVIILNIITEKSFEYEKNKDLYYSFFKKIINDNSFNFHFFKEKSLLADFINDNDFSKILNLIFYNLNHSGHNDFLKDSLLFLINFYKSKEINNEIIDKIIISNKDIIIKAFDLNDTFSYKFLLKDIISYDVIVNKIKSYKYYLYIEELEFLYGFYKDEFDDNLLITLYLNGNISSENLSIFLNKIDK